MRLKLVRKSVRRIVRRARAAGGEMVGKLRAEGKSLLRRAKAAGRAFRDPPPEAELPRTVRRRILILRTRRRLP